MRQKLLTLVIAFGGCVVRSSSEPPLIHAVREGDVAAVQMLVAKGADLNAPSGGNKWSPLLHAVHKNQLGTAKALLDAGADVDRAAPSGMTPLMMAAGYGNTEMVALLVAHRADLRKKNKDGESAYDLALTGMTDIDDFTWFRCNEKTLAWLQRNVPDIRATASKGALRWAKAKRCV